MELIREFPSIVMTQSFFTHGEEDEEDRWVPENGDADAGSPSLEDKRGNEREKPKCCVVVLLSFRVTSDVDVVRHGPQFDPYAEYRGFVRNLETRVPETISLYDVGKLYGEWEAFVVLEVEWNEDLPSALSKYFQDSVDPHHVRNLTYRILPGFLMPRTVRVG